MALSLHCEAFNSGQTIPEKYTCEGENVSPPLRWTGAPPGTQSFALICDDPDAPRGVFSHWVIYNLSPEIDALPEGQRQGHQALESGMQGRNDFGNDGYDGPCPPVGSEHMYYFRLFALDTVLDITAGATRQQIIDSIQGHILERTDIQGAFKRG
jgi:Raf kinase inhibitor-like YbhB/YbcL family protein